MKQDRKERMKLLDGLKDKLREQQERGKGAVVSQNVTKPKKRPKAIRVKPVSEVLQTAQPPQKEKYLSKEIKSMNGTVKWFSRAKGYGFLKGEDEQDYFCHHSQIIDGEADGLLSGDRVSFDVEESPRGKKAINIIVEKREK